MRTVLINIRGSMSLDGAFAPLRTGVDYYGRVTASGGTTFYTYEIIDGYLAEGLSLDEITGEVTGNGYAGGGSVFKVRATDIMGAYVDRTFVITGPAKSVFLTSYPYAVEVIESASAGGYLGSGYSLTNPLDKASASGNILSVVLTETTSYQTYAHPGSTDEAASASGSLTAASLVVTVSYATYAHPGSAVEAASASGALTSATLVVTTSYASYNNALPEQVQASGTLIGATLT